MPGSRNWKETCLTDKFTIGVHHIGLTVPDLHQARDFFCRLLDFDQVGGVPAYLSIFVSDGTILLTLCKSDFCYCESIA